MDERDWTDQPLAEAEPLQIGGCTVALTNVPHLTLVSGKLDAAYAHLGYSGPSLGVAESPEAPDFAIRVARDHAVMVTEKMPAIATGWHVEGFAVTRADGMFAALTVTGPAAEAVVSHGLVSPLPVASASAAIQFAHRQVLLTGLKDGYTMWVKTGDLTFISSFFRSIRV